MEKAVKQVTDKTLADTGERMIPAFHKSHLVYGEHVVRYEAATALVKDKVVLDIASGSGYGSAFLAASAKKVYGVDVDKDAVAYAKKNYSAKNVEYILGDGTSIPVKDDSIDVVISLETIEHIEDYQKFMKEVKRVLKSDGLFILSTPNDVEFPETNHFHIHEFERRELEKLVRQYFKNTKSYFQGTWLYNALLEEEKITTEWREAIDTIQTTPIKLDKCIYFYMLCSDRAIKEKIAPIAAISEHWSARQVQEYEESVREHMDEQAAVMKNNEDTIAEKNAEISNLQREIEIARTYLDRLRKSLPGKLYTKTVQLKRRLKPQK